MQQLQQQHPAAAAARGDGDAGPASQQLPGARDLHFPGLPLLHTGGAALGSGVDADCKAPSTQFPGLALLQPPSAGLDLSGGSGLRHHTAGSGAAAHAPARQGSASAFGAHAHQQHAGPQQAGPAHQHPAEAGTARGGSALPHGGAHAHMAALARHRQVSPAGILMELETVKGPAMASIVDLHCAGQQQRLSSSSLLDLPFEGGHMAQRVSLLQVRGRARRRPAGRRASHALTGGS
jgi:hypothetical protein